MKRDTLQVAVARWFGAISLVLYLAAGAVIVAFEARRNDLVLALVLTGLILVPMAAAGGWILARRAARPIAGLVDAVRQIDPENLGERLAVVAAPREVRTLANEFNSLLDRVEETVRRMRRFTADASHELRTPVSIMRTGIEVTLQRERPAADYRAVLEDNLHEIERVQRTVEGLLALARDPCEYAATMPEEMIELADMIGEAVQSLAPLSRERRVTVHQRLEPRLWVLGDSGSLRLLVLNLLDNALRHTPAGKNIWLELSRIEGKRGRFLVRDEGPGIPAAERPLLFERFYRGGGKRVSRTGGLGLSVVRWVAERHEGRVGLVDDEAPGTTFEVVLPLADDLVDPGA